ncbi:hypothetical protein I3842_01G287300 [Carya illinoinensis]|uniref:DC1 domain-containing protein n=1 Tax=Carya illinoinensis TaxID=32201 RepID=A0A922GEH6_CARIL|nr:hypothetical protein I3842_01G287300 [Carya illinoinensis]
MAIQRVYQSPSGRIVEYCGVWSTPLERRHWPLKRSQLELKNSPKPYKCNGCKEQGIGKRYRCEKCHFDLHKDCMFTMSTTSHELFQTSAFKFLDQPRSETLHCDACGKRILGFAYSCEERNADLHPCSSSWHNLKINELEIDGVKFRLCGTVRSQYCKWCRRREIEDSTPSSTKGWSYVLECETYHSHVYCVTEMVGGGWKDNIIGSDQEDKLRAIGDLNTNGGKGGI